MRRCAPAAPGIHEYELQAELERVFRRHDAQPAYASIVGAGANACVLHYRANSAQARDGDLVLIDAGAEYRGYASDITRTFPVNGRFSRAAARAARPGLRARRPRRWRRRARACPTKPAHDAAVRNARRRPAARWACCKGTLEKIIADGDYKRFYRHKTGHWLGLDVHDVGEYRVDGESRLLEPGMVFTIEPGLYIAAGRRHGGARSGAASASASRTTCWSPATATAC